MPATHLGGPQYHKGVLGGRKQAHSRSPAYRTLGDVEKGVVLLVQTRHVPLQQKTENRGESTAINAINTAALSLVQRGRVSTIEDMRLIVLRVTVCKMGRVALSHRLPWTSPLAAQTTPIRPTSGPDPPTNLDIDPCRVRNTTPTLAPQPQHADRSPCTHRHLFLVT